MLAFLGRKVPSVALMLLVTSIVAFMLPRLGGADAAQIAAGSDATLDQIEAIRVQLGLDRPLVVQYGEWLTNVLQGDFGTSLMTGRPVVELIWGRLGSTLELAAAATILMIVMGFGLGILAGTLQTRSGRAVLDAIMSALLATPPHVTGLILILILGTTWNLLPISGEVSVLRDPVTGLSFLILPAFALALPQAAMIARLTATKMAQVRQEDFVDFAISKGVSPMRITLDHVLRNSLGTAIVSTGVRVGELLAGAVIVEAIFARNGLGMLAVSSVSSRDYTVVQIVVLGAVAIAVLVHLLSEIILAMLDPRVRLES